MTTRRLFFRRLAAIAAAVALAPEIAFRAKLNLPKSELMAMFDSLYAQMQHKSRPAMIDFYVDAATGEKFQEAFVRHYKTQPDPGQRRP